MAFDNGPPPSDDGGSGFVTIAAFSWWRNQVSQLVREVHELKTGLMGSPTFGGGVINELREDIQEVRHDIKEIPAEMAQRRDATLWRGWRGWVLTSLGFIVVSLIVTSLTLWITSNASQIHLVPK